MGYVVEALSIGDIINDDDAIGVAVVAVRYCSEPLLTRCVPLSKNYGLLGLIWPFIR